MDTDSDLPVVDDQMAAQLNDPSQYRGEYGVVVLRPHKVYELDEDGNETDQLKYEVKEEDLEEICRLTNESVEKSFHYPRYTIGHIDLHQRKEAAQPAKLVGVSRNFRVARLAGDGPVRKVIVADLFSALSDWDEARRFPYRSAEYNWKTKKIRGVARILRDPRLEMGTYLNADDAASVVYAEPIMALESDPRAGRKPPEQKKQVGTTPDKGKTGTESDSGEQDSEKAGKSASYGQMISATFGNLNPDEVVAAERVLDYLRSRYPDLAPLLQNKAGSVPDQTPPPADNGQGREQAEEQAAEEEAKNPAEQNQPPSASADDESDEDEDMTPDEIKKLQDENAKLRLQAELNKMRDQEHLQFDYEGELEVLEALPVEKRDARIARLRKTAPKSPAGTPAVEVLEGPAVVPPGAEDYPTDAISVAGGKMTLAQYTDAMIEVQGHGYTPDKPLDYTSQLWEGAVHNRIKKK